MDATTDALPPRTLSHEETRLVIWGMLLPVFMSSLDQTILASALPTIGRDNVILTPHTAFYSVEALEELQTKCASDVARVLSGEKAIYPISA